MSGLLPRLAAALARLSARWVPDAFSIACLLTLLTFALALTVGGAGPIQCVEAWGRGFWELLAFSMQIVVVIFAGYVVAVAPPVRRLLDALAGAPRGPRQAVDWTALLSMVLCWLNWGMGLIAAAMLVRAVARAGPGRTTGCSWPRPTWAWARPGTREGWGSRTSRCRRRAAPSRSPSTP